MDLRDRLLDLMEKKAAKDGRKFNVSILSIATQTPNSVIAKLLQKDVSKRVLNPRIDTLKKIADFFKNEGFDVSLDYLVYGKSDKISGEIRHAPVYTDKSMSIYSMGDIHKGSGEQKTINILKSISEPIAFVADHDISKFFKEGSIFIVDKKRKMEDGCMGVFATESGHAVLRLINISKGKVLFKDIISNKQYDDISIYDLLGIVSQIDPA